MLKVSVAVEELIAVNPLFQVGLQDRMLNLSQLAAHLCPLVSARTKKEVSVSAVHMTLSRLQNKLSKKKLLRAEKLELQHISVNSHLCVLTFSKNKETHTQLNSLYNKMLGLNGYMTITEGMNEITIILNQEHFELASRTITQKPARKHMDVAAVAVKFHEQYLRVPGFLYRLIQLLAFQGINIIELASTATEIVFYIDSNDARLAFDTFFLKERRK
jgi:aspartokinase